MVGLDTIIGLADLGSYYHPLISSRRSMRFSGVGLCPVVFRRRSHS
jgi:hypothetical protein